jgi:hypothetical protein
MNRPVSQIDIFINVNMAALLQKLIELQMDWAMFDGLCLFPRSLKGHNSHKHFNCSAVIA